MNRALYSGLRGSVLERRGSRRFGSVSGNVIWAYLLQAVGILVSLALLPYLTRVLGVENYGAYAATINLATYASELIVFGLVLWGSREIVKASTQSERVELFYKVFALRLFLALSVIAGWLLVFRFVVADPLMSAIAVPASLIFVANAFSQLWVFLGLQSLRVPAILAILIRMPYVAVVLFLVKNPDDVILFMWIYAGAMVVESAVQTALAIRALKAWPPSRPIGAFKVMGEAFPLAVSNFLMVLSTGVGVTVLALFSSQAEVGAFSAVFRVPQAVVLLSLPLMKSLYPRACAGFVDGAAAGFSFSRKVAICVLPVFAVVLGSMAGLREGFVRLTFGPEFTEYADLMVPLAVWGFLTIGRNVLGELGLAAGGYGRELSIGIGLATTVSAVGAAFVVAPFGAIGVSSALVVGELSGLGAIGLLIWWRGRPTG